jgi:SAM-dependent methyltransferase
MNMDSTLRFSDRVAEYVKYRPSYPAGVIAVLQQECGLNPLSVVADIGSGTGILTHLLLPHVAVVYGVEPNQPMRAAAENMLGACSNFKSTASTAEDTGLASDSIDLITAGQAFHWFQREQARQEFFRILKPGGWVVLIWNEHHFDKTPFQVKYEAILQQYAIDYEMVKHRNVSPEAIREFFQPLPCHVQTFPNIQYVDFEGLKGRLLSASYAPKQGHPNYALMIAELKATFDAYQVQGLIDFSYTTQMYYGQLST